MKRNKREEIEERTEIKREGRGESVCVCMRVCTVCMLLLTYIPS